MPQFLGPLLRGDVALEPVRSINGWPEAGFAEQDLDFGEVKGHVGGVQEVVGEIFLDEIALVAEADDKVVHMMGGVDLHDVPEHGKAADFNHELGALRCFFAKAATQTAR